MKSPEYPKFYLPLVLILLAAFVCPQSLADDADSKKTSPPKNNPAPPSRPAYTPPPVQNAYKPSVQSSRQANTFNLNPTPSTSGNGNSFVVPKTANSTPAYILPSRPAYTPPPVQNAYQPPVQSSRQPTTLNLNPTLKTSGNGNSFVVPRTASSTPAYIPSSRSAYPPPPVQNATPPAQSSYTANTSSSTSPRITTTSSPTPKANASSTQTFYTPTKSGSGTYATPNFNLVPKPNLAASPSQSINQNQTIMAVTTPQMMTSPTKPVNPLLAPCTVPLGTTYIEAAKPQTDQEKILIQEEVDMGIKNPGSPTAYSQYVGNLTPDNVAEIIKIQNDAESKVYGSEYKGYSSFDVWSSLLWGANDAAGSLAVC
jgi:hypothetical protein